MTPPQAPRVRRAPPKPDPEADVTVKAANANTIEPTTIAPPPLPEVRPATVVMVPRANVTLQRETATFSIPVSEAVMPESLKTAMQAFERRSATARIEAANQRLGEAEEIVANPEIHAIQAEDQLSDGDRALIRRIAPPAAE